MDMEGGGCCPFEGSAGARCMARCEQKSAGSRESTWRGFGFTVMDLREQEGIPDP